MWFVIECPYCHYIRAMSPKNNNLAGKHYVCIECGRSCKYFNEKKLFNIRGPFSKKDALELEQKIISERKKDGVLHSPV